MSADTPHKFADNTKLRCGVMDHLRLIPRLSCILAELKYRVLVVAQH